MTCSMSPVYLGNLVGEGASLEAIELDVCANSCWGNSDIGISGAQAALKN